MLSFGIFFFLHAVLGSYSLFANFAFAQWEGAQHFLKHRAARIVRHRSFEKRLRFGPVRRVVLLSIRWEYF